MNDLNLPVFNIVRIRRDTRPDRFSVAPARGNDASKREIVCTEAELFDPESMRRLLAMSRAHVPVDRAPDCWRNYLEYRFPVLRKNY